MDKSKMHQPMTQTPKKSFKKIYDKFFSHKKNKFTYNSTNFNFQLENIILVQVSCVH